MKNQPTLFKTCNLYARHRKVSIPASLVSNSIKPEFQVVVPQPQRRSSQDRRLLDVNAPNWLQRHCQCLTTATMTATTTNSSRTKFVNISPEYSHLLSRWMKMDQSQTHRTQHEQLYSHYSQNHPRMIAPIDEVQRCSHARMKVDILLQHRLP